MSKVIELIKEIANEREWNKTRDVCSSWINNGITLLDAKRVQLLRKVLKDDARSFIDERLAYIPDNWPGRKYVDEMNNDLVMKIPIIQSLSLNNNENPQSIVDYFKKDYRLVYEGYIFKFNLNNLNQRIYALEDNETYAFLSALSLVYWLFVKDVVDSEQNFYLREQNCNLIFKKLDSKFTVEVLIGKKESLFFNIKNAIAHGNVEFVGNYAIITNAKNGKVLFKGKVQLSTFVKELIRYKGYIMNSLKKNITEYKESFKIIEYALNGKEIQGINGSAMLNTIGYLSLYERNVKNLRRFLNKLKISYDNNKMNTILSLNIGKQFPASDLRNAFSHNFSLENGLILTDKGIKIDGWDWMYAHDILAITSTLIIIVLCIQSTNQ